jgi:hypothetical protein
MNTVYVVQSVEGHYFSKQGQWLSGKEANLIFVGKYKDDALNQLIDITLKNVDVRARVVETQLNARNLPILEIIAENDLIDAEDFALQEQQEQFADENKLNSLSA